MKKIGHDRPTGHSARNLKKNFMKKIGHDRPLGSEFKKFFMKKLATTGQQATRLGIKKNFMKKLATTGHSAWNLKNFHEQNSHDRRLGSEFKKLSFIIESSLIEFIDLYF